MRLLGFLRLAGGRTQPERRLLLVVFVVVGAYVGCDVSQGTPAPSPAPRALASAQTSTLDRLR